MSRTLKPLNRSIRFSTILHPFRCMNFRATIRSAITSYGGVVSAMITGLLTIRLATHHLSKEEFGLWNFTMQTVGYFMMLELGMTGSGTRLLGEPLARNDQTRMNSWFTLSVIALSAQALLIVGIGMAAKSHIFSWFGIPEDLVGEASRLWTAFLLIQATAMLFKLSFAILYAQNRVYWTNLMQTAGLWITFGVFALMLKMGSGVTAYAWAAGASSLLVSVGGIWAVLRGGHRFRFTLRDARPGELGRMFRFSGSLFFAGMAAQVYAASQGLVATKVLGLEAAAVLAVTTRSAILASQFVWRPFDAFSPRWQIAFCNGNRPAVAREFGLMTRLTLLLSAGAALGLVFFNLPFVKLWTKPEYFGGTILTALTALFLIVQGINRCYAACFVLSMHLRAYIWTTFASVGVGILLMVEFTKLWGLAGIPAALLTTELVYPLWFYVSKGGGLLLDAAFSPLVADFLFWFPPLILGCLASFLLADRWMEQLPLHLLLASLAFLVLAAPIGIRCLTLFRLLKEPRSVVSGDTAAPPDTVSALG